MTINITPTATIVCVNGAECRIWTGTTDRGVPVTLYVTRLQVDIDRDQSEFLGDKETTAAMLAERNRAVAALEF
jgi:hypothetical protein